MLGAALRLALSGKRGSPPRQTRYPAPSQPAMAWTLHRVRLDVLELPGHLASRPWRPWPWSSLYAGTAFWLPGTSGASWPQGFEELSWTSWGSWGSWPRSWPCLSSKCYREVCCLREKNEIQLGQETIVTMQATFCGSSPAKLRGWAGFHWTWAEETALDKRILAHRPARHAKDETPLACSFWQLDTNKHSLWQLAQFSTVLRRLCPEPASNRRPNKLPRTPGAQQCQF